MEYASEDRWGVRVDSKLRSSESDPLESLGGYMWSMLGLPEFVPELKPEFMPELTNDISAPSGS